MNKSYMAKIFNISEEEIDNIVNKFQKEDPSTRYNYQIVDCCMELWYNKKGSSESGNDSILFAYDFLLYKLARWQESYRAESVPYELTIKSLIIQSLLMWKDEIVKVREYERTWKEKYKNV